MANSGDKLTLTKVGICKFCGNTKELKESHLIPSFAGKWLKDTSPSPFLRQAIKPNVRRQDIIKEYLLCGDCEHYFSTFEDAFAKKIFLYDILPTNIWFDGLS